MKSSSEAKHIYQSLNGLRGISIFMVLLTHSEIGFGIGWVGVSVFFVLSGFLITKNLMEHTQQNYYLYNFYIGRAFRIFPIYYLCFFISVGICIYQGYNYRHWPYFALYLQNWIYAVKSWGADFLPYFGHTWTLAIEEQFYLVWPFCILFIKNKLKLISFAIFVIVISLAFKIFLASKQLFWLNYLNTLSNADYLIFGALIAVLLKDADYFSKKTWSYISYSACFFFLVLLYIGNNYISIQGDLTYVVFHFFICLNVFLIIFSLVNIEDPTNNHSNWLVVFLSLKPVVFIGQISYGLYLYHCFIFHWVNSSNVFCAEAAIDCKLLKLGIMYLLSFAVAIISFNYIEKPFLRMRVNFFKK